MEIIETSGHNLKPARHCYIIQEVSVSSKNKISKKKLLGIVICWHLKHNNFP